MKLLALILSLLICQPSFAKPRRHATPTPTASPQPTHDATPAKEYICRTKQQDLELRDWIIGIQDQATQAIREADAANKSNEETKLALVSSRKDADDLAKACESAFACAKKPLSCWWHRFIRHIFWIGGAIIVVIVGLCIASIFVPALGPILGILKSLAGWIVGLFRKKTP